MKEFEKIPLMRINKNVTGTDFFSGLIRAELLEKHAKIPRYDPAREHEGGYQRDYSTIRSREICNLILAGSEDKKSKEDINLNAFMTPISLAIRNTDSLAAMQDFQTADQSDKGGVDFVVFKFTESSAPLWVVDGQHRVMGLLEAIQWCSRNNDSRRDVLKQIRVPMMLSISDDERTEAFQFYLINEKQKKVSTDGANRLLVNAHKNKDGRFDSFRRDVDKIRCGAAVDRLASESNIWSTHLKDFNEKGRGKVSRASFTEASKALYKVLYKYYDNSEDRATDYFVKIVDAFWEAFFQVPGFSVMMQSGTADNYSIFKASPVEVLLRVLTHFTDKWIIDGSVYGHKFGDITTDQAWLKILEPLARMRLPRSGGGRLPPAAGMAIGAQLWLVGPDGAMGQYTNKGAKRSLAATLSTYLEEELGLGGRSAGAW